MNIENGNPWWHGEPDENYESWQEKPIKWVPKIVNLIPLTPFGLNFLTGPRQVGKSTALKLLIHKELQNKRDPYSIFYCPCDELLDFEELGEVLDIYISSRNSRQISNSLIILDEITFVKEWWRAIKSRIDDGKFKKDTLIISGSSSVELLKEKERFPGRRGNGLDFVLFPLNFQEYASLSIKELITHQIEQVSSVETIIEPNNFFKSSLVDLFNNYLITGGFPNPIQDFHVSHKIRSDTKRTYLDWIRGDIRKAEKNEAYMKEIFAYLLNVRCSPISWLSITKETSINSPHTAQTYIETLQQLYIINILNHISQDGKINYKKNKKVHLIDPFLINILAEFTGIEVLHETIVESVVATHLSRICPIFYWKNSSEVDVVGIIKGQQVGFEVKWGPKNWKKPPHLKNCFLLTKENIPIFLGSIDWNL